MDTQRAETSTAQKTGSIGIRGRLIIGFSSIAIVLLALVITTLVIIQTTKNEIVKMIEVNLPSYDSLLYLNSKINEIDSKINQFITTHDEKIKNEISTLWKYGIIPSVASLDEKSQQWTDKSSITDWTNAKARLLELQAESDKIIANTASNTADLAVFEKIKTQFETIVDGELNGNYNRVNGLNDLKFSELQTTANESLNDIRFIQTIEYAFSVVCVLVALIIAFTTSKGILRHITLFREHSSRIASGDLRQKINLQGNDEISLLGNDLNLMTESLANITKQITTACHNMVSTLEEVRHAVQAQSTGATEQASSINQITASLEEIEKSSTQTLEKAKSLGDVAEKTREKGELGLNAIEQSILGMKAVREKVQVIAQTILELSNQTQQVGEITSVVNNLAQQSKMLALNAAIEAAKAGEAGKGFAVVASEVKNLAEQSEESTTQVQKILENIRQAAEKAVMVTEEGTKGVDHGTSLVEETGNIVRSLNDVINETTIATQQIQAAVRQEGVGIEQITSGMNEINQVTASFVDGVKQTTEAMNNLAVIAKNLKVHVDTYKT